MFQIWPLSYFHSADVTSETPIPTNSGPVQKWLKESSKNPTFWDSIPKKKLEMMKATLIKIQFDPEHEFSKRIEIELQKCMKSAKERFSWKNPTKLKGAAELPSMSEVYNFNSVTSETVSVSGIFSQGDMTIEEVMAVIEKEGDQFTGLDLNKVNDDLLKLISEKCQQVSSFKLVADLYDFSGKGLEFIGALKNVTVLNLDCGSLINVTGKDYKNFFSLPHFQENLTELYFRCYLAGKASTGVQHYKKLETLTLIGQCFSISEAERLVASPYLAKTLRHFDAIGILGQGYPNSFTTKFVSQLSQFTSLSRLRLEGNWDVDDATFQKMITSLKNLVILTLNGISISCDAALAIGNNLKQLNFLELNDCSRLSIHSVNFKPTKDDYKNLLANKSLLVHLILGNTTGLDDDSMPYIVDLLSLRYLSLGKCSYLWKGLQTLAESPLMQENLEELSLSHNKTITRETLETLGNLKNLKKLHMHSIMACNDEVIAAFSKSHMADSLETLELRNIPISDGSIQYFSPFSHLEKLMVANCYALTNTGTKGLLSQKELTKQLTGMYLYRMEILPGDIQEFENFEKIQNLIIGESELTSDEESRILNLPNIKALKTKVFVYDGCFWKKDY